MSIDFYSKFQVGQEYKRREIHYVFDGNQRTGISFSGKWNQLPPQKQIKLQKGAKRLAAMPPEKRKAAFKRFKRWQSLPDAKKRKLRKRYQRFKKLSPQQQRRLRQARNRFRKLNQADRQRLRKTWRRMTPQQRKKAILRNRPRR